MLTLEPPFRHATPDDVQALCEFTEMASHGLALWVWRDAVGPGGDPWAYARERRAARLDTQTHVVADLGQGAVSGLIGYAQPAEAEPVPDDMPPVFVPLQELENAASGSWYVNVLATYPEARRKGLAHGLLGIAEAAARAEGCPGLSIIVEDANAEARALYARHGYGEAATRPLVGGDWGTDSRAWILLTKTL